MVLNPKLYRGYLSYLFDTTELCFNNVSNKTKTCGFDIEPYCIHLSLIHSIVFCYFFELAIQVSHSDKVSWNLYCFHFVTVAIDMFMSKIKSISWRIRGFIHVLTLLCLWRCLILIDHEL